MGLEEPESGADVGPGDGTVLGGLQPPAGVVTKKSRKAGVVAYAENPFVTSSTVTTRRKRVTVKGGKAIVDLETGQTEEVAEIALVREVDDGQFIKLFTQNLRIFFDLTPVAMKVLQVILAQVQQRVGTDQVMLNVAVAEHYFTSTGQEALSRSSFFRAVHELIDKRFIAESMLSGLYFINPNLFFNGDRVRFINEFKRKRSGIEHKDRVQRLMEAEGGPLGQGHQLSAPAPRPRPMTADED